MASSEEPLAVTALAWLRRHALLVLVCCVGGAAAGGLAVSMMAVTWVASGHVRVGTVGDNVPVVDPQTAAFEAQNGSFVERARARAGGAAGALSFAAVYRTDIVQVRARSADREAARALVDAASALLVEEQAKLIDTMQTQALARLPVGATAAAVPVSRPPARLEPVPEAVPGGPRGTTATAAGLAVGIACAVLLAGLRDAMRRR
jgi:hypothetical protein